MPGSTCRSSPTSAPSFAHCSSRPTTFGPRTEPPGPIAAAIGGTALSVRPAGASRPAGRDQLVRLFEGPFRRVGRKRRCVARRIGLHGRNFPHGRPEAKPGQRIFHNKGTGAMGLCQPAAIGSLPCLGQKTDGLRRRRRRISNEHSGASDRQAAGPAREVLCRQQQRLCLDPRLAARLFPPPRRRRSDQRADVARPGRDRQGLSD